MARLFVALDLPEETRDALMALQTGFPTARWVDADNLHLTLAFIGEVDPRQADDLDAALSGVSAPRFDLTLKGCGCFGDRSPHALWAGVEANPALDHLQAKVESALRRAGGDIERRRFTPHVTLAYLRGAGPDAAAAWVSAHGLFRDGPIPIDGFHLFESTLRRSGASYDILASYPLSSR